MAEVLYKQRSRSTGSVYVISNRIHLLKNTPERVGMQFAEVAIYNIECWPLSNERFEIKRESEMYKPGRVLVYTF